MSQYRKFPLFLVPGELLLCVFKRLGEIDKFIPLRQRFLRQSKAEYDWPRILFKRANAACDLGTREAWVALEEDMVGLSLKTLMHTKNTHIHTWDHTYTHTHQ